MKNAMLSISIALAVGFVGVPADEASAQCGGCPPWGTLSVQSDCGTGLLTISLTVNEDVIGAEIEAFGGGAGALSLPGSMVAGETFSFTSGFSVVSGAQITVNADTFLTGELQVLIAPNCQAPAATTTLWAVMYSSKQISVVNPADGTVVGGFTTPDFELGGGFPPSAAGLSIAEGGSVLIYGNDDSSGQAIYRLDPTTGVVLSTETAGIGGGGLALSYQSNGPSGPAIYTVSDAGAPFIVRQDGFSGPEVLHHPGPMASGWAQGGDDQGREFANITGNQILEYNPITGATVNTFTSPTPADFVGLAFDGDFLYATTGDVLYIIDPDDGALIQFVITPVAQALAARPLTTPSSTYRRGDANGDGAFDISDPIFVLAELFSSSTTSLCDDASDSNDDGLKDIGDAIYGLGALFAGGPMPPSPNPGCGLDPTADPLDCLQYGACP